MYRLALDLKARQIVLIAGILMAVSLLAMVLHGSAFAQDDGTIEFPEHSTDPVATFTADDPEGATSITWSVATDATIDGVEAADIADGADHFTIDEDGVLKFSSPPDFENPSGEGATSNTYKVVVLAADAATGGQTGYHKVTVKVTNLNESGTITLATSTDNGTPQYLIGATLTAIAEDGDITNAIQTFTVDRPGEVAGVTWEWYSGGTRISAATTNSYQLQQSDVGKNIRVLVRYQVDGKPSRESAQKSTEYPVLAARVGASQLKFDPAAVSRTISEGAADRNVGARVTATGNHGTIRYTLTGTDADAFDIDAKSGQISTAVALNFEAADGADNQCATAHECQVTVTATDSTGVTGITATVNIAITNVDEKPTFTETDGTALSPELITSPENRTALFDANVGPVTTGDGVTYAAMDPEGLNVNLTLMGADAARFSLSDAGVLSFAKAPDREMPTDANKNNVYEVTVRANDGTMTADRSVKVTVSNVDEAPEIALVPATGLTISGRTSVSLAEGGSTAVGTYTVRGMNAASATWTVSGTDAGAFSISSTGALSFRATPDYEIPADANADNVYMVTLTASAAGESDTHDVVVTVTDVDEDTTPPADPLLAEYDPNGDGVIEEADMLRAVSNFFGNSPTLSETDMLRLVVMYFQ
jgi:serralysin